MANKRFTSVEIVQTEDEAIKPSSAYFIPKDNEKVKMIITDDNGEQRELDGTGEDGVSATIEVGTVATLPPSLNVTIENVGTDRDAIFNFSIPKGEDGESATIQLGTVVSLNPDDDPTVTNTGTSSQAIFNFGIPKGEPGQDFQLEYNNDFDI